MTLFYLISNIYGLYQIAFTPEFLRVLIGLFTGCVIELIAVASLPLIGTVKDEVYVFILIKPNHTIFSPSFSIKKISAVVLIATGT